jgi:hypothetical protein
MRVYDDLVVLVVMWVLLLVLMRPEVVEGVEALCALWDILYMGSKDALFGVSLGMRSIVDIRIVAFVACGIARHAWIPPQRAALAGRRGQRK